MSVNGSTPSELYHTPPAQEELPELLGLSPRDLFMEGLQASEGVVRWVPPMAARLAGLLPQFDITRLIGYGGMGAVYQGTQPGLKRAVAIKLLPVELTADEAFVIRFEREAQTLARLHHPGIVMVHEYGQTAEGHLYFAMEFVDGCDLRRLLHQVGGLSPHQALDITIQICEALHYAHEEGIVHRDIKPSNVLITPEGKAKLTDFGLARPVQEDLWGGLTASRVVMGTPDYMAPEQRQGQSDHRADIYALGVMLYEMLTGKYPQGSFSPPSQNAGVDARLDDIVNRAMRQEPENRYQKAEEMKKEVHQVRSVPSGEKTLGQKGGPGAGSMQQLPGRTLRRNILIVGLTVVVAGLAITAGLLWQRLSELKSTLRTASGSRDLPSPSLPAPTPTPAVSSLKPVAAEDSGYTKDMPFINSLGMKFVPVPGTNVLMCIHETRKSDYAAFARANPGTDTSWNLAMRDGVPVTPGDDYPVTMTSWVDATAFCGWLSHTENQHYRLPTDREWSFAAGIGGREPENGTPEGLAEGISSEFPWGRQWPPPHGSGNFADRSQVEAYSHRRGIPDYKDGFANTAPVMSFTPNALGLYDLSGNVWEWIQEWFNSSRQRKTLRGGCFNDDSRFLLLSSQRVQNSPETRIPAYGFRCVVEAGSLNRK